jgi:DNA-binding CsgD family transcriptional regulator
LLVPRVTNIAERDVDGVLAVVAEAALVEDAHPFGLPVVERLLNVVPAERGGYFEAGVPAHGRGALYAVQTVDLMWDVNAFLAAEPTYPLRDACSASATTAVKLSDFLRPKEKERSLWYQSIMRPHGAEYECKLWLPAPTGITRGFFFIRGRRDRDFDERDRSVLTVLRPHLAAIRERWERRRRVPGLTDREEEVLRLLKEGLTNQEIADRLVIATGTVRTHLENIFDKLGVHTRTAAVARAFGR